MSGTALYDRHYRAMFTTEVVPPRRPLDGWARLQDTPAEWCVACAGGRVVRDAHTGILDACPVCDGRGR